MVETADSGKGIWALASDEPPDLEVGRAYTPSVIAPPASSVRKPFAVDPDLVDRGLRAHQDIVDTLASWVAASGAAPLLPISSTPQFDLAWKQASGVLAVAEIKSLTDENEERQLRLGLGQVLRYRHLMLQVYEDVSAWLVVERQPISTGWIDLCDSLDVRLAWPPHFEVG
jgi:hypothetical protein